MREEKQSQITMQGLEKKLERVQSFLVLLATKNKKRIQTEEKSPMGFSKTHLFCSSQIAHTRP